MSKILIVSNVLVPPIVAGSCKCIDEYSKLLKEMGHEVYFLYSGRESDANINIAVQYWGNNFYYFKYSFLLKCANYVKRKISNFIFGGKYSIDYYYPAWGLARYVKKMQGRCKFNTVIVNYIWMTKLFDSIQVENKILFTHDSFTNKDQRINQKVYSLSPNQESKGLQKCNNILSIQDNESIVFSYLAPKVPIHTVYMPIKYNETQIIDKKNILFFSGNSDINLNGILNFIKEVLPLIISRDCEITLLVAGGICSELEKMQLCNNVRLLGRIDDIDDFYKQGAVVINPVYQGTGLKIKTLEGISYGKVVIVHPHSVDGLYQHGEAPVFVAHDNADYAQLIMNVFLGKINKEANKIQCKQYLEEMNLYIKKQYRSVNNL